MGRTGPSGSAGGVSGKAIVVGAAFCRPHPHRMEDIAMTTALLTFAKAVVFGSLAGAAPYLLFTVPMGLSFLAEGESLNGIMMMILPLLITFPIVLGASVIFGLPLTAFLSGSRRDRQRTYATIGLALGALIPTVLFFSVGGVDGFAASPFFAIPGMIAGTVTGHTWGKWREALADQAASAFADD